MEKREKIQHEKNYKSKLLGFTGGGISQALQATVLAQLSYYLTNSVYLAAATVGILLLVVRMFDGVTDLIAGILIDKCHSKWGRARPFTLCFLPMWVALVFMFSVPSVSQKIQIVYVFLIYIFMDAICRTFIMCAQTVHLKRAFHGKDQITATTMNVLIASIASLAGSIGMPILIGIFEGRPNGWTIIALIYAIPCTVLGLLQFFLVPELEHVEEEKKEAKAVSFKEQFSVLFHNKYIFLYCFAYVCVMLSQIGAQVAGTYYFKYIIGDVSSMSVVGVFGIFSMFSPALIPVMKNKIGVRKSLLICLIISAVSSGLRYLFPTNLLALGILGMISTATYIPMSGMIGLVAIDCMKYSQWRTNIKVEGIISSITGVATKIGQGFGSAIAGVLLGIVGFNGAVDVQPQSVNSMISFLYYGLPTVGALLAIVILSFYSLDKLLPKIERDLSERV